MHPNSRMWTLDCEDYVKNFKNDNSLFEQKRIKKNSSSSSRKRRRIIRHFRHLLPITTSSMAVPLPLPPPPAISEQFSWKDHMIMMSKVEKKKKNISSSEDATAGLVVSSRWNPTPEQLKALQEMYQRGVRTPSAEEIQLIAAKLSHFGRIEGKNVFYWFQNHKARERQKRRRQPPPSPPPPPDDIGTQHDNSKGSSDFCPSLIWEEMDADQNKKIVTNTSNSILAPKGCGSMHETTAVTESRSNGWTHLDEKQQRQQQSFHRTTEAPLKEDKKNLWADQEKRDDDEDSNSRVLHLFPVIVDGDRIPFRATKNSKERNEEEEMSSSNSTLCAKITPNQFYEFL